MEGAIGILVPPLVPVPAPDNYRKLRVLGKSLDAHRGHHVVIRTPHPWVWSQPPPNDVLVPCLRAVTLWADASRGWSRTGWAQRLSTTVRGVHLGGVRMGSSVVLAIIDGAILQIYQVVPPSAERRRSARGVSATAFCQLRHS